MRFARAGSFTIAVALFGAACSSGDGDGSGSIDDAVPVASSGDPVVVENQGGSLEGHTPRGFAGMGTGLFVGDNLNPGFPDGDGVQLFVTFDLPDTLGSTDRVVLRSDSLQVRGDPFADLGVLSAAPVTYTEFGPHLFDMELDGEPIGCTRVGDFSIECDVSSAFGALGAQDGQNAKRVQFRLRFDQAGDRDGTADLAMFNRGDSNTNEAGLFRLEFG